MKRLLYRYAIDVFTHKHISGWCYHRGRPARPVELLFVADNRPLGTVTADGYREDLHRQGSHPTGHCGFRFILPEEARARAFRKIEVKVAGLQRPLCTLAPDDRFRVVGNSRSLLARLRGRLRSRVRSPQQTVFFMHIPKTAGTSFNTYARTLFPPDLAISHIKAYRVEEYRAIQERYRFISGHLRLGEIRDWFDLQQLQLYTIIREPLRQLHSHLNWLHQVGQDPDKPFFQQHNDQLQELARKCGRHEFTTPAAIAAFVADLSETEFRLLDNCQTRFFLQDDPLRLGPDHLREALGNRSCFAAIGLTERYDQFKAEFAKALGRKLDREALETALNRSKRRPLFAMDDASLVAALHPLIAYDLQLYEAVAGNL